MAAMLLSMVSMLLCVVAVLGAPIAWPWAYWPFDRTSDGRGEPTAAGTMHPIAALMAPLQIAP